MGECVACACAFFFGLFAGNYNAKGKRQKAKSRLAKRQKAKGKKQKAKSKEPPIGATHVMRLKKAKEKAKEKAKSKKQRTA